MSKHLIKLELVRLRGKARREGRIVDLMLGVAKPPHPLASPGRRPPDGEPRSDKGAL